MSKLVTIIGGSGFVGRYIARRMAADGWRVRVACRRPELAGFVRTYGNVGQVEPVFCNVRDDASVAAVLKGADAVVNCVGILSERGRNTFDAVQAEAPGRVARLSAAAGVAQLVQVSALGADDESDSDYARTKALGEAAVTEAFPGAVILRPSIIFGAEDQFFNRFGAMSRTSPVIPMVGADTKFQPVWVDDVAAAAQVALEGRAAPGIYELGGPEVETFRELMDRMLTVVQRRRVKLALPFWMAKILSGVLGAVQAVTFGLVHNGTLTGDQIRQLGTDNVVTGKHKGFADLGLSPTAVEAVLPDYLWVYRPSGQYAAITDSAKNLRA